MTAAPGQGDASASPGQGDASASDGQGQAPALPDAAQVLAHVKACAALLGLPLGEARALAVAGHLQRSAGLAALLEAQPLPPELEPAEVWRPAPFPDEDPA